MIIIFQALKGKYMQINLKNDYLESLGYDQYSNPYLEHTWK